MAIYLGPSATEPFWITVAEGCRIQCRPATVAATIVARQAAIDAYRENDFNSIPESNISERKRVMALAAVATARSYALFAIVAWEGVFDEDKNVLDVTPENIELALTDYRVVVAIDDHYTTPSFTRQSEKKSSDNSPNGILSQTEDSDTANIVRSPAKPARMRRSSFKRRRVGKPGK